MPLYKHTQTSYPMIFITLAVLVLFVYLQLAARAEAPSVDSGTNVAITALMAFILVIPASFSTLTVTVDKQLMSIRFGWGIFRKKFVLSEIASVKSVRNPWYYGWGIKLRFWPTTLIFSVAGFDAVELTTKKGSIYRIGTDEPGKLLAAIQQARHV